MTGRPHQEGEEFNLKDLEQWCLISPLKGDILFIDLASTDYAPRTEVWTPFLVMSVELLRQLGTLSIEAKFLGTDNPEVNKELSSRFNRRTGRLHLCGSIPCLEQEAGCLHVTRFIWHTLAGAEGWLSGRAIRTARKWLDGPTLGDELIEDEEPMETGEGEKGRETIPDPDPAKVPGRPGVLRRPRAASKDTATQAEAFSKKAPKPKPAKPKAPQVASTSTGKGVGSGGGAKSALDPAKVEKLREELKRSKQKIAAGGPPDPSPGGEDSGEEEGSESASSGSTGSGATDSAVAPEALTAGTLMKSKTTPTTTRAIKDVTTGDFHTQLIQRAAGTAEISRKDAVQQAKKKRSRSPSKKRSKESRRRKDDGKGKKDGKKKKRKKKKKKKEKKHKDRKTKTLSDGRTVNCSSDSNSDSEEEPSTDEDAELEAPLRKRSQKRPGSVLNLLLEHIADQLQQSAELDVPASGRGDLTSGVKVVSYLALAIRPHFAHKQKELREMHNLATSIDLLRQGQLARLGDVLAGRLVAIHQSLLDASWTSARHLEVMPMPEGTALSDGVLLAARKHGRQVSRAQDITQSWRSDKGRGRGKKGLQWSHYEGDQESTWWQPKGKGKSQKKGKAKKDKDKEAAEKPGEK